MKVFISGILVGIANIIPGVSGGTMMVIMGVFHRIMESISGLVQRKNENRKEDFLFLCKLLAGALIGLVLFAKVIDYLFISFEIPTLWWFIGMVVASIPIFINKELKNDSIKITPFIIGIILILGITYLNPGTSEVVVDSFPTLSTTHLLLMLGVGFISGFTMLLPGVSGSMVLLIIGQYHLFKAYLSNVTSFQLEVLLPLAVMGVGILIGIIVSAKATKYVLYKSKDTRIATLSLILGLVVASSFVLIPIAQYSQTTTLLSIGSFIVGVLVVYIIERFA